MLIHMLFKFYIYLMKTGTGQARSLCYFSSVITKKDLEGSIYSIGSDKYYNLDNISKALSTESI